MTDERFRYLNHTSVEGLDLIFKVLCLICAMKRIAIGMMGG